MTKEFQTVLEAAIPEIIRLREMATSEEIQKLSMMDLEPLSEKDCIYGQMTGHCFSVRANHLIRNCAVKGFGTLTGYLQENVSPRHQATHGYSALEVLIVNWPRYNTAIIRYLKGETDTLNLPPIE